MYKPQPYEYKYGVADDYSKSAFDKVETQDEYGKVVGSYKVTSELYLFTPPTPTLSRSISSASIFQIDIISTVIVTSKLSGFLHPSSNRFLQKHESTP